MRLFFDLDGPILDVSEKYYRLYTDLVTERGGRHISKADYWDYKRRRIPDERILKLSGIDGWVDGYRRLHAAMIETPKYLRYDRVWPGVRETLVALGRGNRLVLLTLRRSPDTLCEELERLELTSLFHRVLYTREQPKPPWATKVDLIRSDGYQAGMRGTIVGDTETDIAAGKKLGLRTVGILSGIRTRRHLENAGADVVISSIVELATLLEAPQDW